MAIEFKRFPKKIRADRVRIRAAPTDPLCYDVSLSSAGALESTNEEPRALGIRHQHAAQRAVFAYCILSAIVCAIALCIVLRVYRLNLHVPFTYWGDALYFDAWVKGLMQGHLPWHHPRLGAPFGADWRDFPINLTIEALVVRVLAIFTSSSGLVLNLLWMLSLAMCAGLATYALQRLGIERWTAASLGVIYALQPFAFYRGVAHLNLVFYLVPLLATGAIEIAAGRLPHSQKHEPRPGRSGLRRLIAIFPGIPLYLVLACVAQGFSYIYNAFFSVVIFTVAALIAFIVFRRRSLLITGLIATFIICSTTLINLTPSVIYWTEHGRNPAMAYKTPVDAETYGLKLRHLLTPVPDNPLPPLRYIEKKLDNAGFTGENENAMSKLGTIGSIGLLFLLGSALVFCLHPSIQSELYGRVLGACSALTLACLLLATVGGFGTFFNVFVAPDIRCYDRIVVFVDFFAITAVGLLLTRAFTRLDHLKWSKLVPVGALAVLVVFGVSDQAVTATYRDNIPRESQFGSDASFVRAIESTLPRGASVFQLPFTDFPAEGPPFRMREYDQSRPYLCSDTLRWSWGGISGREAGEWARQTSALPVKEMLANLSAAGFSGLWIDRFGYAPGTSPEREIAVELGSRPLLRSDGRIAFYNLSAYRERLRTSSMLGNATGKHVEVTFLQGFYGEERNGSHIRRWCSQHDLMLIHNGLPQSRTVKLMMTLQTNGAKEILTISSMGRSETIKIAGQKAYTRTLELPARGSASVFFDCKGGPINAPADPRSVYFGLIDPRVVE